MADFSFIAPNIIIGTDPSQSISQIAASRPEVYRRDVLDAMNTIWDSWTGTAIIQGIAQARPRKVVITPFSDPRCNAESNPHAEWAKGGEINVRFSPSFWTASGGCGGGGPGAKPDEVLLHELVHAYRQIRGHIFAAKLNVPGFRYTNEHEFYAILLTNIHMSAKNARILRRDHGDHKPLYPELSSSEPFLKTIRQHRDLVADLIKEDNTLCNTVSRDNCIFNPVSYFMRNRLAMLEMDKPKPRPRTQLDIDSDKLLEEQMKKLMRQKN